MNLLYKIKEFMIYVMLFIIVLTLAAGLFLSIYLDYKAYRQRFPQAEPWTYLFRGSK